MGIVYRATHLHLQRVDAVKVITPELADDVAFRSRFKRESQAAARIDHPNVIPIYGAGEDRDLLYIAMRLVEGTDVGAMLRLQKRINPARAAEIVMAVAAALDAAHEHGLIHRDVKPANVLVSTQRGEQIYLTDFGLAKVISASDPETKTGAFIGTTDYVSPEQVLGQRLDARSDVYSLGAMLFHMLTGRVPFPAEFDAAKLVAHTRDPVPSVLSISPDVPPHFEAVVARAMAKAPEERFVSAGDLGRAALAAAEGRAFSDEQGSVARGSAAAPPTIAAAGTRAEAAPPADTNATDKRFAARPLLVGGAVILILVTIVSAVIALGGGRPAHAVRNGIITVGNSPNGITFGQGSAWVVNAGDGTVSRIDQRSGTVRGTISYANHAQMIGAITIWGAGVWVADSDAGTIAAIDTERGKIVGTPTQLDGHPAAITAERGDLWTANYDSNTVTRVDASSGQLIGGPIHVGRRPIGIAPSDDAIWVTNAGDGSVSRIDVNAGRVLKTIPVGGHLGAITVTRGDIWVADYYANVVIRIDVGSGRPVGQPIPVGSAPTAMAASSDGVWVANAGDGTVTRLDARTGRALDTIPVGGRPAALGVDDGVVWVASWSQPRAQYRGPPGTLRRIDASTGKLLGT
jgi:serine/threonine-protein kinase